MVNNFIYSKFLTYFARGKLFTNFNKLKLTILQIMSYIVVALLWEREYCDSILLFNNHFLKDIYSVATLS